MLLSSIVATAARAQDVSTIELLAVDAVIDGNEATSLGELDGCVEADVDSEVSVDVIVNEIPEDRPMGGFQYNLGYDPEVLELTEFDYEFLLAAEGTFEPFDGLSEPLPDSDGSFVGGVADLASNADIEPVNMETGAGVLARYTFKTLAVGTSEVGIDFEPGDLDYPTIIAPDNEPTSVENIGAVTVAVGEPCPADAEPKITPIPSYAELFPTPAPTPTPTLVPIIDPSEVPEPEGGGIDYTLLSIAGGLGFGGLFVTGAGVLFYRRHSRS